MKVKIESLDHFGRGIANINGKIIFVENALKGELVDITIYKEKKNFSEAKINEIIEKSSERETPICKYYGICGGCNTMHMSYKCELEFKKEKVKNILKKYALIDVNPKIIESEKRLAYRNKITLHYKNEQLGFMKEKSNEIIEIDNCPLVMKEINEYLKNDIKESVIIRENTNKEIVTNIDNKTMIENINNYKFMVDANSFFQVNHYICSKLFKLIEKNIDISNICLDLYSGVGTLSIVASKKAKKVYGIEVNNYSYKNAVKNLELNNIKNVKFINGLVEKEITKIKESVDTIITDPPRSGMDYVTIDTINKLKPKKIIYVSCNPLTLARDLKLLDKYKLENITLLDMFPNTYHVESFCVLKLK